MAQIKGLTNCISSRTSQSLVTVFILLINHVLVLQARASLMSQQSFSSSSIDDTDDHVDTGVNENTQTQTSTPTTTDAASGGALADKYGNVDDVDGDDDDDDVVWFGNATSMIPMTEEECRCEMVLRVLKDVSSIKATCVGAAAVAQSNERKVNALQIAVDGLAAIIDVTIVDDMDDDYAGDSDTPTPSKETTATTQKGSTTRIISTTTSSVAVDEVEASILSSSIHVEDLIVETEPRVPPNHIVSNVIEINTKSNPNVEVPTSLHGISLVIMEEPSVLPRDCWEVQRKVSNSTGVYTILPDGCGQPFQVYCDMYTDGGGWTVLQRRQDGEVDFSRGWGAYRRGFGNLLSEFWLGLDKMTRLTMQDEYELWVEVMDFNGTRAVAEYQLMRVGDHYSNFRLELGTFRPNGSAGDSLSYHNSMPFTTHDRDNDLAKINCAKLYPGGWWHNACLYSNLNGVYIGAETEDFAKGITWFHFGGFFNSMKFTEMKVRPVP